MSSGGPGLEGGDIAPTCPRCRMTTPDEARFCPHCGTRLKDAPLPPPPYVPLPQSPTLLDVGRGVASYTTLVLLVLIAVNVGIVIGSIGLVLSDLEGQKFTLFMIVPLIVELLEIGGLALTAYYLFLVVAIVGSFLWMIRKSLARFLGELRLKPASNGHSPLYIVGTLFFSLIALNFYYYILLGAMGIVPETPDFGDITIWETIFLLANASVWEELITRVLLIGVPLIFVGLARKGDMRWLNYFLGGGFKLGKPELALLVFSSAMFGLAHLTSWDIYKVLPTFIAGLALGYLFLRVGLYAAIMLHFTVDFASVPIEITQSLTVTLVIGILTLVWIAVGSCYFYYYSARAMGFVLKKDLWPPRFLRPKPQPIMYTPQRTYPPSTGDMPPSTAQYRSRELGFGFSCRYCGNTEARYQGGDFYCLRCGRRN